MGVVVKQSDHWEAELRGKLLHDCTHAQRRVAAASEDDAGKGVPYSLATEVGEHCVLFYHQDIASSQQLELHPLNDAWNLRKLELTLQSTYFF